MFDKLNEKMLKEWVEKQQMQMFDVCENEENNVL